LLIPLSSFAAETSPQGNLIGKSAVSTNKPCTSNISLVKDGNESRKPGKCYSARNCTGRVIGNHQHAHNCKNVGGKSWRSGVTGKCSNL
ncbi:hypothetical protein, partial [Serratia sp. C2(2)]|uniref:hypothetical protein n=1 Tax=Serratia sp. C2(2) TaxID=3117678 RepID=UPI002ED50D9C|nr:hypothetical protein [Serratia sp. C2(2)]